jgi:hypothetical protein
LNLVVPGRIKVRDVLRREPIEDYELEREQQQE